MLSWWEQWAEHTFQGLGRLWLLWSSLKVNGGHLLSMTSFKGLANYNPRAKFTGYLVLHGTWDKNGFYIYKQFQKIKRTICLDTWKFHVCNLNISVHKYSCIRQRPLHSLKYRLWLPSCLLRNLYAGQEATVRIGHGTTDQFKIGKGVH